MIRGVLIFIIVITILLFILLCWSSHKALQDAQNDITVLEDQNRFLKEDLKNAQKSVCELCMSYINCKYKEKYTRCCFVPSEDSSRYKLIMYKGTYGKTVACTYIIDPAEHKITKINETNIIKEDL